MGLEKIAQFKIRRKRNERTWRELPLNTPLSFFIAMVAQNTFCQPSKKCDY